MSGHDYLSTACFHREHGYCNAMVGYQGVKRPGQCKFCDARCSCACHGDGQSYRLRHPLYARQNEAGDYVLPTMDNDGSVRDIVVPRSQFERLFEPIETDTAPQ